MRKQFPSPKGLGSRSFADRYADSRNRRSRSDQTSDKSRVKFLGIDQPLKACLRKSGLRTDAGFSGIFYLIFSLPLLFVIIGIFFGN